MSVRKIFIVLITIVICVILGAFVLNVLMPNAVTGIVNAVESTLFNATGMSIDFNGDGVASNTGTKGLQNPNAVQDNDGGVAQGGAGVAGYN